jgi:type II secretory pathway component PulM
MNGKPQAEEEDAVTDPMDNETLEFFKLDKTDRKVLFWLMDNVPPNNIKSWIEYVTNEYKERGIDIDAAILYKEICGKE